MTHVLLSGVLGAAVLALVLMHKSQQKLASRLAKIEAELAAEKIARLTQQLVPPALPAEEVPAEPARRKRHLALYIGGGVAAIVSSLGARLRSVWKRSPALATTGTIAVVAVASTAAALCLPTNGTTTDTPDAPQPAAVSDPPHAEVSATPDTPPGTSLTDDNRAASNDTPYKITDDSNFKVLRSGAEEPSDPAFSNETEHPGKNADQLSEPIRPTTPGPNPSDPQPSPSDAEPDPSDPEPSPSDPEPAAPLSLTVGPVRLADTEKRWCEDVTAEFRNTGGSPATSGTVTFGTHILDLFGTDWATIKQTQDLPAPIPAGSESEHTWTLCVDAWRVPPGWHIDTLDVTAVLN
ncbi:hypothetical protein [Streptomyces sp. NPDC096013]|uniref:hypothetical protein n=1 Tax=Streptomyces sp. NPDC096013 TaxID=3366069 RepID=UPI0037FCADD8